MAEVAKSIPVKLGEPQPAFKEPASPVSASRVVDLVKVGDRVTLTELREFVERAEDFDGHCQVTIVCWQVDPSSSNKAEKTWETQMHVQDNNK